MHAVRYILAFGVAPLFLLAALAKVATARRSPDRSAQYLRHALLYALAGLVWLLAAFLIRE
jgi:hypothetical protein